jgi:putative oxidoreductase
MRGSLILIRALEVLLGGLFVYAGLLKCLHPYEFAEVVQAYRLLPESLVGAVAAVLPWVEMGGGLFLALGLKRRSALLLLAALLAVFLAVILITMGRGLKIDCGCGLFFQRQVGPVVVLEDAGFLLWAGGLYWWELLRFKRGGGMASAEASFRA